MLNMQNTLSLTKKTADLFSFEGLLIQSHSFCAGQRTQTKG